jgi:hypothetical protein
LESMDQLFGAVAINYEDELTEDEVQAKVAAVHEETDERKEKV